MANTTDKSILTAAGKALLAQLNAEEKPLIIDKMMFANVPNRPEFPQPDDEVPTDNIVYQEQVDQRGRLSADSVIYSATLTSDVGPFEFNWTGAYCSEYGVLVTIDHHALTPKTVDEPGVAGNTLVRSVVLEYKDIAEITNITVDASSWQYNATDRMKKMDSDVAQSIIDQNGKDWFINDGFLVTPSGSAYNIKAGASYVSGNRVSMEFDRSIQVPNKPSFIYIDAYREGTPTGEQVTLFDFVVTAEEKDDYTDAIGVKHFVCKIALVLGGGSVSDLRPEGESATKVWAGENFPKKEVVKECSRDFLADVQDRKPRLLDVNKTQLTNSIKPKGHYIFDGQYSTLKLEDRVENPVFYDGGAAGEGGSLFECKRMCIDANMHNNNERNHSAGVFWLTDWRRVRILDVDVVNAYRNAVNLMKCRNVVLSNYSIKNSGLADTEFGGYTYGATFENGTYGIDVTNFEMKDCYGFGIHIYNSGDAHLKNVDIQRLNCKGVAIAVTLTSSSKIKLENFTATDIDGDCLEINACSDVEIVNFNLSSINKRALVLGDNGTGINNKRIRLANGQLQALNQSACCALNRVDSAEFDNVWFYKPIDILPGEEDRARDILFRNCKFKFKITGNLAKYPRFKYEMSSFEDIQIMHADEVRTVFSSVGKTNEATTSLAPGEYIDIPLGGLRDQFKGIIADVKAVASFSGSPSNQTGIVEFRVKFDTDNAGTPSITEHNREGTQVPRYIDPTVATDDDGSTVIRLTNNHPNDTVYGSYSGVVY
jgi:hypothetical protein